MHQVRREFANLTLEGLRTVVYLSPKTQVSRLAAPLASAWPMVVWCGVVGAVRTGTYSSTHHSCSADLYPVAQLVSVPYIAQTTNGFFSLNILRSFATGPIGTMIQVLGRHGAPVEE